MKTILAAASAGLATNLYANTAQQNPWTELLTGGTLCILTYITSVLLLGALKQEDLDNLENISRGLGPIYPITKKIITLLKPLFKPLNVNQENKVRGGDQGEATETWIHTAETSTRAITQRPEKFIYSTISPFIR